MDLSDAHTLGLFLEVYGTLPRAGPGGDEHTGRALGLVPGPTPRTVLDLGCGPAAQTVALAAALPEARILAVDMLPSMAAEANRRFVAAAIDDRVEAVVGDMAAPPVEPGSQDLIWAEGAIYNLGVTEALRTWRPLLAPGGTVGFTEPIWLVDSPPAELRDWWLAEYPALTEEAGVRASIEAASYQTIASFPLPASAWWDEYYEPMQARIAGLKARHPDDPIAAEVVAAAETEIDFFERFSECYSYAFFIVQPTD
ncbi:MAG: class I SAM-dependent methyltransferase [Acidimicrobiales bacterium]|nr:class I SAM-dependent methyltransferase [Acidimicrobiales bacterium]